jgi:hypothetical protein
MKAVDEYGRFGTAREREEPLPQQAAPAGGMVAPALDARAPRASGWRAVLALPLLRRSVILAEIIGQPRSLKGWDE